MPNLELRFGIGTASVPELRAAIDELLAARPPSDATDNAPSGSADLQTSAASADLDESPNEAEAATSSAAVTKPDEQTYKVTVDQHGGGSNEFLTEVIIVITSEATLEAAKYLWSRYLFPGLRRKLGDDAVGEERPDATPPAE